MFTRGLHRDLQEWDRTITDAPLDVERLPADGITRTLGALANLGLGYEDSRPAAADIIDPATRKDGDCDKVEEAWAGTIQARAAGKLAFVQMFVNQEHPVVMRKGRGAYPSAVLLQPVAGRLNGRRIVYPEGALVSIDAIGDEERIDRRGSFYKLHTSEEDGYTISSLSELHGLSFLRFSPLAHSIGDRARFFRDGLEIAHLAEIPDAMSALHGLAGHLLSTQKVNSKK